MGCRDEQDGSFHVCLCLGGLVPIGLRRVTHFVNTELVRGMGSILSRRITNVWVLTAMAMGTAKPSGLLALDQLFNAGVSVSPCH